MCPEQAGASWMIYEPDLNEGQDQRLERMNGALERNGHQDGSQETRSGRAVIDIITWTGWMALHPPRACE
jgi:hypothetical protein